MIGVSKRVETKSLSPSPTVNLSGEVSWQRVLALCEIQTVLSPHPFPTTVIPQTTGFNPRSSHTKDSKMLLDNSLLNTPHYKWSNLGKEAVSSLTPQCSRKWKGNLWVTLNYCHQLNFYLYIYIYIYTYITHIKCVYIYILYRHYTHTKYIYVDIHTSLSLYIYIYT